jgi:4-amino-4-deoxy-L-arabinose transferase-like glycosyltransferase
LSSKTSLLGTVSRQKALWILTAIVAVGAAFRFYNLGWGAPYYHFHIDEHFVLGPADTLRRDVRAAAMGSKFFMYSPLMMYLINIVRGAYEAMVHPLDLTVPADQVTYMVLSRAIAATFGTATILVVYAIAARIAGRVAGLFAAFFLACAVLHLRDSHFATTDMPMVFFCVVALWFSLRIVERGDLVSLIGAGASVGAAVACKYTGAFALGVVGVAYFLAPRRPGDFRAIAPWAIWVLRGTVPIIVAVVTFFVLDPLVLQYPDKFLSDFREQITNPLTGVTKPIFNAQFADLTHHRLYWFTNLLWWGLGPMLEILGLLGVIWLLVRAAGLKPGTTQIGTAGLKPGPTYSWDGTTHSSDGTTRSWDTRAAVAAAFPIIYFTIAGQTVAPMIRYSLPLAPALAIAAGVVGVDWLKQPRGRSLAMIVVGATVVTTGLYALAYMNVFRQPDSRLQASQWLVENVPRDSKVLVEPSQNTPPMGAYLTATNFHHDYVLWGGRALRQAQRERRDYYHLFTLDTYVYLYGDLPEDEKRSYIASRLAQVDWIVIDHTYVRWYHHLPESENAAVKRYYEDLFAGKLGFALVKTFKVYPSLFGWTINDDASEFTFRHFDHPSVYILRRFSR